MSITVITVAIAAVTAAAALCMSVYSAMKWSTYRGMIKDDERTPFPDAHPRP